MSHVTSIWTRLWSVSDTLVFGTNFGHCMMAFVSSARSTLRAARLIRHPRLLSDRRHASTYNAEVAGLNDEQAEVFHSTSDSDLYTGLRVSTLQFRSAITEFAQREIAPRAAEIDRTDTFPGVSSVRLPVAIPAHVTHRTYGRNSGTWACSV